MNKLIFLMSLPLVALLYWQEQIDEQARFSADRQRWVQARWPELQPKPTPLPDQSDDRGMFTVMVHWLVGK